MLDVSDTGDSWRVIQIKIDVRDAPWVTGEKWRKSFADFNALPNLTKIAIAVISMHPVGTIVVGYGRRVSEHSWWLFADEELLKEYDNV